MRAGEDREANAVWGACAILKYADLRRGRDDADEHERQEPAQRLQAGRRRRLDRERADLLRVVAERLGLDTRPPPVRVQADRGDGHRRHDLCDHDRDERRGDADRRADRDRDQPQGHRPEETGGAHVVPVADQQRRARHAFGRLHDRDQRCDEQRPFDSMQAPDPGREQGRENDRERADHTAEQLHPQAEPEQPLEAAPVAARGVPVPVLDDDLVDRQVEEELQEPGDREDEGEAGEVGIRQLACRDNRGENAEEDGTVDPDGGRDTPPEDTEAHLRRPV